MRRNWSLEIGKRYGRLLVQSVEQSKNRPAMFVCKCDCGNTKSIIAQNVIRGKSTSCGCFRAEVTGSLRENNVTHNASGTKLYRLWDSMKRRCTDIHSKDYKWYGGKGVSVCSEWLNFSVFQDWAYANGYVHGLSIDRIDSSKGYCPDNCRWISLSENARIAHEHFFSVGNASLSLHQWGKIAHRAPSTIAKWITIGDNFARLKIEESIRMNGDNLSAIQALSENPRDKHITINGITKNYTDWSLSLGHKRCAVSNWIYAHGLPYAEKRILSELTEMGK